MSTVHDQFIMQAPPIIIQTQYKKIRDSHYRTSTRKEQREKFQMVNNTQLKRIDVPNCTRRKHHTSFLVLRTMLPSCEIHAATPRQHTAAPKMSFPSIPGRMLNASNKSTITSECTAMSCFMSIVSDDSCRVSFACRCGTMRSWAWSRNLASVGSMGACSSIQARYVLMSCSGAEENLSFAAEYDARPSSEERPC